MRARPTRALFRLSAAALLALSLAAPLHAAPDGTLTRAPYKDLKLKMK